MNKALFRNTSGSKIISATDIDSRKDYLQKYQGHLFCPEPGCNAQLVYAELPFKGYEKIFKTHKDSEHSGLCPHRITHKEDGHPIYTSETFSKALSEHHIQSVLKGLYEKNTNQTSTHSTQGTNNTSRKKNADASKQAIGRVVPSIDPDATPIKAGEREPAVRKRRSHDLILEDNNMLRGVYGLIVDSYITDTYIELIDKTPDGNVSLLFYNAFRDKSQLAYKYIQELAFLIKENNLRVPVCCIGVIEFLSSKIQIQIMNPNHITFENVSIFNYMKVLSA